METLLRAAAPTLAPTLPLPAAAALTHAAEFWGTNLDADSPNILWLWEGYLAHGNVTLLTSQWKSGKTTLISILLSRLKDGGQLAGLNVRAGKAIIVTEEPRAQWRRRHKKLDVFTYRYICVDGVHHFGFMFWAGFMFCVAFDDPAGRKDLIWMRPQ